MNNENLKPCPFCGGKAEVVYIKDNQYVRCLRCGAVGANTFKTEDVIAAWNRRSYSKKSNNSKSSNYPEKQDSPKELMDFVKFCRNASANDIRQIHDRARDLIAKSKGNAFCVKQNGGKAEK